jgi:hypothetical protein
MRAGPNATAVAMNPATDILMLPFIRIPCEPQPSCRLHPRRRHEGALFQYGMPVDFSKSDLWIKDLMRLTRSFSPKLTLSKRSLSRRMQKPLVFQRVVFPLRCAGGKFFAMLAPEVRAVAC